RHLRRRRWTWVIGDLTVLILLAIVSEVMQRNVALAQAIQARTPHALRASLAAVILFTTTYRMLEVLASSKHFVAGNDAYLLRVYKILAVMEAFRVASFVILLLYGLGAIDALSEFLRRAIAILSVRASYFISTLA